MGTDTRTYGYPAFGAASVRPHAVTSVTRGGGIDTFGYDPNGSMISRSIVGGATTTFAWNANHQLSTATTTGLTTRFVYGPDGGRLLRYEPLGTTLYLPGMELREPLFQAVTGTRYYTDGTGATVAMRTPAGLTWLTADYRGTMQIAVDNTSGAVKRQRYGPFGTPRGSINELPTDRGYLGATEDDSTGLIHLGARYYDPLVARFISTDPLLAPTAPQTVNPYTYALNNPLTYSDPVGLKPVMCEGVPFDECGKGKDAPSKDPEKEPRGRQQIIGQSTGPSTVSNPKTVNYFSRAFYGASFENLGPIQQRQVLKDTWCSNNPKDCEAQQNAAFSGFAHALLGAAGMIPIAGEAFDAVDALLYLTEGDWTGAALSAASLIPVAGDVAGAGKLGRLGLKGLKGLNGL
jgi:RHS repeat-associated protein